MKNLTYKDFDSPDSPGSGKNVSAKLISMTNKVQRISGVQLTINSGYRTQAYHEVLKSKGYETSSTSPHLKGLGVDVGFPADMFAVVLKAGIKAGFKRIGLISITALHFDIDENSGKSVPAIWTYANTPTFIKGYINNMVEIIKKKSSSGSGLTWFLVAGGLAYLGYELFSAGNGKQKLIKGNENI